MPSANCGRGAEIAEANDGFWLGNYWQRMFDERLFAPTYSGQRGDIPHYIAAERDMQ
jgi:hypothetical protein